MSNYNKKSITEVQRDVLLKVMGATVIQYICTTYSSNSKI